MNGADKAQLRQVRAAILGTRPDKSLSSTLYPVYVAIILTGSYGVPAAQQLFHLSMVLVRPSSILILDEPEQRLDTDKRDLLTRILLDRRANGSSMVIACHDPAMTEALADTVVDILLA